MKGGPGELDSSPDGSICSEPLTPHRPSAAQPRDGSPCQVRLIDPTTSTTTGCVRRAAAVPVLASMGTSAPNAASTPNTIGLTHLLTHQSWRAGEGCQTGVGVFTPGGGCGNGRDHRCCADVGVFGNTGGRDG